MKPKASDLVKQLKEDPRLREELRQGGIPIKEPPAVRKTFRVDEAVLNRFLELAESRGMKVRTAITEAMRDWCDRHEGKK